MPKFGWIMFFAFIVSMVVFSLLSLFFRKRNWKQIYTAYGDEQYFKSISKLKDSGIKYSTKVENNRAFLDRGIKNYTIYEIYVKNEEEYLARKALNK